MINTKYEKGPVQYGYSLANKGWTFVMPGTTLILHRARGQEKAHKVANILAGSYTRSGGIDNLARANIKKVEQS